MKLCPRLIDEVTPLAGRVAELSHWLLLFENEPENRGEIKDGSALFPAAGSETSPDFSYKTKTTDYMLLD